MNSLVRTFQGVMELGREMEEPFGQRGEPNTLAPTAAEADEERSYLSTDDVPQLKRNITELLRRLQMQKHRYYELHQESQGIESQLSRLRLQRAYTRDLWLTTGEMQEQTIQRLLEHHLYGGATGQPRANGGDTYDATYVSSLLEQVEQLKMMVQKCGEDRSALRGTEFASQKAALLHADGSGESQEVRRAVGKLLAYWEEERQTYERQIEQLEKTALQHAEVTAMMSDTVKQERDKLVARTHDDGVREELERWRRGELQCAESPPTAKSSHSVVELNPFSIDAPDSASLPTKEVNPAASDHRAPSSAACDDAAITKEALQAELLRLRHDGSVRDEALDSLYQDNKRLQELLQKYEEQLQKRDDAVGSQESEVTQLREQYATECLKRADLEERLKVSLQMEARLRGQIAEARAMAAATASRNAMISMPKKSAEDKSVTSPTVGSSTPTWNPSVSSSKDVWKVLSARLGQTNPSSGVRRFPSASKWRCGFLNASMTLRQIVLRTVVFCIFICFIVSIAMLVNEGSAM